MAFAISFFGRFQSHRIFKTEKVFNVSFRPNFMKNISVQIQHAVSQIARQPRSTSHQLEVTLKLRRLTRRNHKRTRSSWRGAMACSSEPELKVEIRDYLLPSFWKRFSSFKLVLQSTVSRGGGWQTDEGINIESQAVNFQMLKLDSFQPGLFAGVEKTLTKLR